MIQIAVAGATGRMGRCVLELAARDEQIDVAAALTFVGDKLAGTTLRCGGLEVTVADRLGAPCDALIDFSVPTGTIEWLKVCERLEIPMVTGVTGHDEEQLLRLRDGARVIPIVAAANFSPGMCVMLSVVGPIVQRLGEAYDVEIVETHHRQKSDAPSGTARELLRRICEVSSHTDESNAVFGREGDVEEPPSGQIGIHAIRMGDVVGQHEVHISGAGETLTIRHTVQSRDVFARGAIRAAQWLLNQSPGLYTMDDVLGV